MSLIYRGSVKDIYQQGEALRFIYSDRYSIFDWGEMPDEIPQKGEALAFMASTFFEHLQQRGIKSHFVGQKNSKSIDVRPVRVLRPEFEEGTYNYTVYASRPENCLVPLEVIFRYRLGLGNSLEKRLKKNPDYLMDLDIKESVSAETIFVPALVEFSTKLESTDRYLTKKELAEMKALDANEIFSLKQKTQNIAEELKNLFLRMGVELWDGKVEYGFGKNRELFLVDSIGPDELRLTFDGLPLSKEFLRQIYVGTSWAKNVSQAKDLAKARGYADWKKICREELNSTPAPLTVEQMEAASSLYQSLANELARVLEKKLPFDQKQTLQNWSRLARRML